MASGPLLTDDSSLPIDGEEPWPGTGSFVLLSDRTTSARDIVLQRVHDSGYTDPVFCHHLMLLYKRAHALGKEFEELQEVHHLDLPIELTFQVNAPYIEREHDESIHGPSEAEEIEAQYRQQRDSAVYFQHGWVQQRNGSVSPSAADKNRGIMRIESEDLPELDITDVDMQQGDGLDRITQMSDYGGSVKQECGDNGMSNDSSKRKNGVQMQQDSKEAIMHRSVDSVLSRKAPETFPIPVHFGHKLPSKPIGCNAPPNAPRGPKAKLPRRPQRYHKQKAFPEPFLNNIAARAAQHRKVAQGLLRKVDSNGNVAKNTKRSTVYRVMKS